jgi:hypothetical protein
MADSTRKRVAERVATTGHWVVGRSGRHRLVVPYLCACGEEHVAIAKGSVRELDRRAPCGLDVHLALRSTDGGR